MADAMNNRETEGDDDPECLAYSASRNAITYAEPQTIEGLVAKARVTKAEIEEPVGAMADVWAEGLVEDILRLFGGEGGA